MIELTDLGVQTVLASDNVLFEKKLVHSGCAERHREGSGIITLTKPGRYRVTFSGNIAVPTGGTVGEVLLALSLDGETLVGTIMRAVPADELQYFNVSVDRLVDVFCGSSATVAVENPGTVPVSVDNPLITVVRVA